MQKHKHAHMSDMPGKLLMDAATFSSRISGIKAFLFDWDGVFNNGEKNIEGHSAYSETDSMGINMMRFHYHLLKNRMPVCAIISGEHNLLSYKWAKRDHLHAVYAGFKHKETALEDICTKYSLLPEEVLFVYDDVLDLSLAAKAGLRFLVHHAGNPAFESFCIRHQLADYVTRQEGGAHAVREISEVVMQHSGNYDLTIQHRMQYSKEYLAYLEERDRIETPFLVYKDGIIQPHS
ncbi:MAG: phosphatase [Bacteroidetes bacterium]|nr:phosphatase [Bacteroidota bacterium]